MGHHGGHTGAILLLTGFIIPVISTILLFAFQDALEDALSLFFMAFVICIVSSAVSWGITEALGGRSRSNLKRVLIVALLKSLFFAIAFTFFIATSLSGGVPLIETIDGRQKIDYLVLWAYIGALVITWIIVAIPAAVIK
jgi:hypothetical protein